MAMPVPLPDPADDSYTFDARASDARASEGPIGPMTFDEYLNYEGEGDTVYEYVGGMVYAKSNGTFAHGTIAFNVAAALRANARHAGCTVHANALAVRLPDEREYVPDVMVHCGPRPANEDRSVERPCFIVEVLSPSTSRVDLVEKLAAYGGIDSLQAYWIVEATWRCVHRHWRDADGRWQREDVTGDGALPVPCLMATTLTLDDVYEDVDVPHEPPHPVLRRVRELEPEYVADGAPGHVPGDAD